MQIGHQRLGSIDHGHGLDVHFTRSRNAGVEQALAAQENVFCTLEGYAERQHQNTIVGTAGLAPALGVLLCRQTTAQLLPSLEL